MIYARNLSVAGILDGIRSGRVFIDLTGSRDRSLDFQAESGGASVAMGGTLAASAGQPVTLDVHIVACAGASVHFFLDGEESAAFPLRRSGRPTKAFTSPGHPDGQRHWLRAEVIGADQHILLLGNPIYVNWTSPPASTTH